MTQLNDSLIGMAVDDLEYLRKKTQLIDGQKKKNLEYCYELEKSKKEFAASCCALQAIK